MLMCVHNYRKNVCIISSHFVCKKFFVLFFFSSQNFLPFSIMHFDTMQCAWEQLILILYKKYCGNFAKDYKKHSFLQRILLLTGIIFCFSLNWAWHTAKFLSYAKFYVCFVVLSKRIRLLRLLRLHAGYKNHIIRPTENFIMPKYFPT